MIIGRGLIAKALKDFDDENYIFYVNGISNSIMEDIPADNFEFREIKEMSSSIGDKTFIYFSTSQVNSPVNHHRPYVKHKYILESIIEQEFSNYLIIRTSNLVGHNPWNRTTLFNYLFYSSKDQQAISVNESVLRNMLDVSHFASLLNCYLDIFYKRNTIIELVNPISFSMAEIISEFEFFFRRSFIKKKVESSNQFACFEADTGLSELLIDKCNIGLDDYIHLLLKEYYPHMD